ncbi:unnamed protein product, partial [Owenia fusiformis]
MKKLFKFGKGKKNTSQELNASSGSLNKSLGYEVREKDLNKLHKAAWSGDVTKIHQFAKKDPNITDKLHRTALHFASTRGHSEVIEALISTWRAKTGQGDNEGKTPLLKAIECDQEACARALMEYKADVNVQDLQGETGLHYTARSGNETLARLLIDYSIDPDIQNKNGLTALHVCAEENQVGIARLLLQSDADPNIRETVDEGRTPLMLACRNNDVNLIKMLLKFKVDIGVKDKKGWTAEDHAVMQGNSSCSELLQDFKVHNHKSPSHSAGQGGSSSHKSTPVKQQAKPALGGYGIPAMDTGGTGDYSDDNTESRISEQNAGSNWSDTEAEDSIAEKHKPQASLPKLNL